MLSLSRGDFAAAEKVWQPEGLCVGRNLLILSALIGPARSTTMPLSVSRQSHRAVREPHYVMNTIKYLSLPATTRRQQRGLKKPRGQYIPCRNPNKKISDFQISKCFFGGGRKQLVVVLRLGKRSRARVLSITFAYFQE